MPKISLKEEVSGKSADFVYESFINIFKDIGFEIWKKRPLAWLFIAKGNIDDYQIDATLVVRATSPVGYTLTLASSDITDDERSVLKFGKKS
jgi:hypothetical protein